MNKNPFWKYLLLAAVVLLGLLYAAPNLYSEDPAVQVSRSAELPLEPNTQSFVGTALAEAGIEVRSLTTEPGRVLARLNSNDDQLKAADLLRRKIDDLGDRHVVALTRASRNPDFLNSMKAKPISLGLDLRGGVHFLMQIDFESAEASAVKRYSTGVRRLLRGEDVRYRWQRDATDGIITVQLDKPDELAQVRKTARKKYPDLTLVVVDEASGLIRFEQNEEQLAELREQWLQQNITTLRNRVNELGVSEPIVQRQGDSRVVVQLPGMQDPALAKTILGSTATLEYRPAVDPGTAGAQRYMHREGYPVFLSPRVIARGDNLVNATAGINQDGVGSVANVTLDSEGGKNMLEFTQKNLGKPMAVLFIEDRYDVVYDAEGNPSRRKKHIEEVISVANIQGVFSTRFQTSGLDTNEANTLALLLRSGALAAPMYIVEERTIGPSMGQDNINKGVEAIVLGFIAVIGFMLFYYRGFGLVANCALALNLVLIVGILSLIQAVLTLPGIAGIVLTVGMAVDANVLIFERIREEYRDGAGPQAAIRAGYDKAVITILDANITTLIAAAVLFGLGSGPIRGFAVTLGIGILTSMFTAIFGTRVLVNLRWGNRPDAKLPV